MCRAGNAPRGLSAVVSRPGDPSRQPHRLDERMAKKRVHEIAKERGISSKDVIAVLQRAGLDVKTAAQSIDENDIAMAFSNGGQKAESGKQAAAGAPASQSQQSAPSSDGPQRP